MQIATDKPASRDSGGKLAETSAQRSADSPEIVDGGALPPCRVTRSSLPAAPAVAVVTISELRRCPRSPLFSFIHTFVFESPSAVTISQESQHGRRNVELSVAPEGEGVSAKWSEWEGRWRGERGAAFDYNPEPPSDSLRPPSFSISLGPTRPASFPPSFFQQ